MISRTRRALGAVTLLIGFGILAAFACPVVATVLDALGLIDSWDVQCPTKITRQVFLIAGIVVLVLGQRLISGRKLHTGEKPPLD